MFDKDIVKVELIKNVRVQNTHNGFVFPKQNIMKVYFRSGDIRTLDLFSGRDITDMSYFKIINGLTTKIKTLFKEY